MKSLFGVFLFCTVLGLAACGSRQSQGGKPAQKNELPPGQLAPWKIELKAPETLVYDQPMEFTVTVKDSAGQLVSDALVELSLRMKTMDMGENKARLRPLTPGVYSGKALFTMAGSWEVEARVTKNGLTAIEVFPYIVKEPPQGK